MALDPSARESNVRDSVKRFFVDNIERTERIPVTFDVELSTPKIQGVEVDRWISVIFGSLDTEFLSTQMLDVYCCSKKDSEGFKLAQLRDTVMGYLSDTTATDGMKRIPFYRSYPNLSDWTLLGAMLVQEVLESSEQEGPDKTKYKLITCKLRFPSKI